MADITAEDGALDINTVNFESDFLLQYRDIPNGPRIQEGLFRAQRLVKRFIQNPTVRGVQVFHGLGSGKTTTGIVSAIGSGRPTIIMCAAALIHVFVREYGYVSGIISRDSPEVTDSDMRKIKKSMAGKIEFATLNASNKVDQLIRAAYRLTQKLTNKDRLEGMTLIVDECHKLYSIISNGTEAGLELYNMIRETKDIKLIFMSGTPIVNDPFELVIMANLLSPLEYAFMEDYEKFYTSFVMVDEDTGHMELTNIRTIKERLVGLISYFPGHAYDGDKTLFPQNDGLEVIKVNMGPSQWQIYTAYKQEEIMEIMRSNRAQVQSQFGARTENFSTYHIKTRLASNFVPPGDVLKKYGTSKLAGKEAYENISPDDLKGKQLEMISPKYAEVIKLLNKHKKKKILIYSSFLNGPGLKMLGKIMDVHGWNEFTPSKLRSIKKNQTYCIWSGELSEHDRRITQNKVNAKRNKYGEDIRVFMTSPAGTEGLSLLDFQIVIIIEPHWNITRIRQVIGRVMRYKSHINLPPAQQRVKTYMMFAIPPKTIITETRKEAKKEKDPDRRKSVLKKIQTTDEEIFITAQRKQRPIDQILELMKSVSVDCSFYHQPNDKYSCFVCAPKNVNVPLNHETVEEQLIDTDGTCTAPLELPISKMKKIKPKKADRKSADIDMYSYKGKTYVQIPEAKPPQFIEVKRK